MEFRFLSDAREVSSQRRSYELIDTTDSSIGYVIKVERGSVRSALRTKKVQFSKGREEGGGVLVKLTNSLGPTIPVLFCTFGDPRDQFHDSTMGSKRKRKRTRYLVQAPHAPTLRLVFNAFPSIV